MHTDVVEIHGREFERLTQRISEVTRQRSGRGIMVLGAAGVGKSHILARLSRWTHDPSPPRAITIFLHNLLVAPQRLPRYMLTSTIGALTNGRGAYEDCKLSQLWELAVRSAAGLAPEAKITHENAERAMKALIDSHHPFEKSIQSVLLRVGLNLHHAVEEEGRFNSDVVDAGLDWLSGEQLEPEQAESLHKPQPPSLRDDQDVERVFKVLAGMAQRCGMPFVLCVDQFDNLSEAQVAATTRFMQVLIDMYPTWSASSLAFRTTYSRSPKRRSSRWRTGIASRRNESSSAW
ncbi:MAG: ATP-binding protein [Myxococcales bacterium]|nr:ATP-binding protein [Myxococcales bacterium]